MPAKKAKSLFNNPLVVFGGIVGLILIAFLFYRFYGRGEGTPFPKPADSMNEMPEEQPTGTFEFLDVDNNYAPSPEYPFGRRAHIVVHAPGAMAGRPITLTATSNGEKVWEEVIKPDEPNCADANTCSIDGPKTDLRWDRLEAHDVTGALMAFFGGGLRTDYEPD